MGSDKAAECISLEDPVKGVCHFFDGRRYTLLCSHHHCCKLLALMSFPKTRRMRIHLVGDSVQLT